MESISDSPRSAVQMRMEISSSATDVMLAEHRMFLGLDHTCWHQLHSKQVVLPGSVFSWKLGEAVRWSQHSIRRHHNADMWPGLQAHCCLFWSVTFHRLG